MRNKSATPTSTALRELMSSLRETIADLEGLVARAEHLADDVDTGRPLSEIMPAEPRPLIIAKLVEVTDRLHEAGGAVRRAEATQLREEGLSQEQIAEIFGVTRQRVAKILASPVVKQPVKRPRPRA